MKNILRKTRKRFDALFMIKCFAISIVARDNAKNESCNVLITPRTNNYPNNQEKVN